MNFTTLNYKQLRTLLRLFTNKHFYEEKEKEIKIEILKRYLNGLLEIDSLILEIEFSLLKTDTRDVLMQIPTTTSEKMQYQRMYNLSINNSEENFKNYMGNNTLASMIKNKDIEIIAPMVFVYGFNYRTAITNFYQVIQGGGHFYLLTNYKDYKRFFYDLFEVQNDTEFKTKLSAYYLSLKGATNTGWEAFKNSIWRETKNFRNCKSLSELCFVKHFPKLKLTPYLENDILHEDICEDEDIISPGIDLIRNIEFCLLDDSLSLDESGKIIISNKEISNDALDFLNSIDFSVESIKETLNNIDSKEFPINSPLFPLLNVYIAINEKRGNRLLKDFLSNKSDFQLLFNVFEHIASSSECETINLIQEKVLFKCLDLALESPFIADHDCYLSVLKYFRHYPSLKDNNYNEKLLEICKMHHKNSYDVFTELDFDRHCSQLQMAYYLCDIVNYFHS